LLYPEQNEAGDHRQLKADACTPSLLEQGTSKLGQGMELLRSLKALSPWGG
jgi:hypothetical protein